MADHVEPDLDPGLVDEVLSLEELDELLLEVGTDVATRAAVNAPKDTGRGAESIHAEVHRGYNARAMGSRFHPNDEDPTAYVSWDQEHFYMLYAENGTEHEEAQHFLVGALESTQV